ncbi:MULTISPECIES: outer membrane beta-barrel family protein [unclassified Massilia]|uniref:outer membrane beta-barrel family protein n=1 Tax=unclassified Massilia TaxID=2609279 RepID=UPI00068FC5F0|nr:MULTISPECIES: outer membrane beta-barrel family protein [unclassified Massilia]ALK99621.2 TonB-dependent receptor [Massilia sp. WG5]
MKHSQRKRAHYLALGLALCDIAILRPALAQTAEGTQAAAPANTGASTSGQAAPGGKVQSVNVVGERQTNRIDRQVYDVKSDVSSTNGTAADALNNVPSVSVDPDGTVSLRGSTNVQILVDGKPSAMLQGDNRGPALQAMPSEDIDSIEVINNPGAEFGNEGGGGPILNLVMKRSRRPGGFGVVNTNVGSAGRYNSALNGQYNTGRWGVQGGVNVRHDGRDSRTETERDRVDPRSSVVQHSSTSGTSTGLNDSAGLRGQLTYNLGDDDTVEANVGYMKRTNDSQGVDHYVVANDGVPFSDYLRTRRTGGENTNSTWGARWDHKGAKIGELFRMDLRVSSSDNASEARYANDYLIAPSRLDPSQPFSNVDADSLQDNASKVRIVDYTGDYERPLDSGAILKLGYKLIDTDSRIDTRYFDFDPASGAAVANGRRTNGFEVDERDAALYGSYQWKLSERWGALVGMRTEYTHMDLDLADSDISAANRYLNWIPSAFATYKLTPTTNLRFAYAHRIRRATGQQLNPFVIYQNEFNESSGNPNLKPVQTDSFEIGYETKAGKLDANLRAYYRADRDMIRSRQTVVNDTVLLTTLENGGSNRAGGLEFTLSGKVTPKFSINTSGNLAFTEQQQIDLLGGEYKRTASSLSVRGRFNYELTAQDHLQLMINAQGKTLAGAGYREPSSTLNLSYRRAITPALNLVFNVTDVFRSQKVETITDTASLKEHTLRTSAGRIAYIGLSYRFGGVQGGGQRRERGGSGEGWRGAPPPGAGPGGPGGFGGGRGG